VVFVSINYRLGPLGFPQGKEAEQKGLLNLALKDELTALEWVHKHIGKFGGDKNKVRFKTFNYLSSSDHKMKTGYYSRSERRSYHERDIIPSSFNEEIGSRRSEHLSHLEIL
jgi:hypothetical protein